MAISHFESFYRILTDEELAAERARLLQQLDSFFSSQQVGSKGYSRDTGTLKDRIGAIGLEMARRQAVASAGGNNPCVGIMRHDEDLC
jgi:hypothetical protein